MKSLIACVAASHGGMGTGTRQPTASEHHTGPDPGKPGPPKRDQVTCRCACAASSASQERAMVRPHVSEHGQCNGGPGSLWGATLSTPQFPPTGHQNEASLSKKEHCLFGTRFRLTWQHTLFLRAHQRWGGHPHNLICRKSSEFLLSVGAYSWWDCLTHC